MRVNPGRKRALNGPESSTFERAGAGARASQALPATVAASGRGARRGGVTPGGGPTRTPTYALRATQEKEGGRSQPRYPVPSYRQRV